MADPFWETDLLKTFRLLRRHMNAARDYLGWIFDCAGQGKHGIWVEFRDASRRQLIGSLPDGTDTPAGRAAAMVEVVLTTPPQRWPVLHCSICDPGQAPATGPRQPGGSQARRSPCARAARVVVMMGGVGPILLADIERAVRWLARKGRE